MGVADKKLDIIFNSIILRTRRSNNYLFYIRKERCFDSPTI